MLKAIAYKKEQKVKILNFWSHLFDLGNIVTDINNHLAPLVFKHGLLQIKLDLYIKIPIPVATGLQGAKMMLELVLICGKHHALAHRYFLPHKDEKDAKNFIFLVSC